MKKHKPNRCPLLEGLGIKIEEGYEGIGICQVCELERCVFDHPGKVSKADREILGLELKKWRCYGNN